MLFKTRGVFFWTAVAICSLSKNLFVLNRLRKSRGGRMTARGPPWTVKQALNGGGGVRTVHHNSDCWMGEEKSSCSWSRSRNEVKQKPLIQTSLSQNPAWPFLHIKQSVSREFSTLSRGLLNCQDVHPCEDSTTESLSEDWWTTLAQAFIWKKHCFISFKNTEESYFLCH